MKRSSRDKLDKQLEKFEKMLDREWQKQFAKEFGRELPKLIRHKN